MTVKAWLKGLAVFVLSSLITALAATSLDPAQFNFSRQGAIKLGTLVLIIALKAVFLYFRKAGRRLVESCEHVAALRAAAVRHGVLRMRQWLGAVHLRNVGG